MYIYYSYVDPCRIGSHNTYLGMSGLSAVMILVHGMQGLDESTFVAPYVSERVAEVLIPFSTYFCVDRWVDLFHFPSDRIEMNN